MSKTAKKKRASHTRGSERGLDTYGKYSTVLRLG